MNNNFLEKELSYKLIGVFIEISQENGCLFKEKIYYTLLKEKLKKNNLKFVQFPRISLYSNINNSLIGHFFPDFIINNKIIIEVKAYKHILESHINQLTKYLISSKFEIGFLVNFGRPRAEIIRRIYTSDRKSFLIHK